METAAFRINRSVCRLCRSSTVRPIISQASQSCRIGASPHELRALQQRWASTKASTRAPGNHKSSSSASRVPKIDSVAAPALNEVHRLVNGVLKNDSIPSEEETLRALRAIESAAQVITGSSPEVPSQKKVEGNPASALLAVYARPNPTQPRASVETVDILSELAYKLVKHDPVFVTPAILSTYVTIQTLLGCPSSFPEIFKLYATKPSPSGTNGGKQIVYKPQNPRAIAAAVPANLANSAVDCAILHRDLQLSLDIIASTFRMPAFKRSKVFRKVLPPAAIAACAPLAAYSLASSLATMQVGLPPEDFTAYAFAGMLTYVSAVGTLGYVALTTSNDQMERVTWAIGMPLLERWLREEERAACDRVAKAWGFREKSRWGEEVGEEWEGLKDWLGFKGMTLDKVGLLEGME